jgi:hypothetical protein
MWFQIKENLLIFLLEPKSIAMSPRLRYFLRVFLVSGGLASMLLVLANAFLFPPIFGDPVHGGEYHLAFGLLLGLTMASISLSVQEGYLRDRGLPVQRETDLLPQHHGEWLIEQDIESLWDSLQAQLSRRRGWKLQAVHSYQGRLIFKRGISEQSWGETVILSLRDMNDGFTLLRIESKPVLSTTLVDHGRNHQNVEAIAKLAARWDRRGPDAVEEYTNYTHWE